MNKQRLDEWDEKNFKEHERNYHAKQWREPKQSTIRFNEYITPLMETASQVIDLACGEGGSTFYLSEKNTNCNFLGLDISKPLIESGNNILKAEDSKNLVLEDADWFNLKQYDEIDGVVSLQSLSWLPNFENPLEQIFTKIQPKWLCFSSLFYEGDISVISEVKEHESGRSSFYNTYSIPEVSRFCERFGYTLTDATKFDIDIDIPKPKNKNILGTYTELTADGQRRQITGPLLLNWHFITITRT